jgi:hypothetical protein
VEKILHILRKNTHLTHSNRGEIIFGNREATRVGQTLKELASIGEDGLGSADVASEI